MKNAFIAITFGLVAACAADSSGPDPYESKSSGPAGYTGTTMPTDDEEDLFEENAERGLDGYEVTASDLVGDEPENN